MYSLNDKRAAVKNVERMMKLPETGNYTQDLTNEIINYQEENNLKPTGFVNYETFLSLNRRAENERKFNSVRDSLPFLSKFPYTFSDMGSDVLFINALLSDIIEKYRLDLRKPRGIFFSNDTVRAVEYLRKVMIIENGEHIDLEFIYNILRLK